MIDNLTEAIRYFRQKARNIFLGETFDNYGKLAEWLTELQERREAVKKLEESADNYKDSLFGDGIRFALKVIGEAKCRADPVSNKSDEPLRCASERWIISDDGRCICPNCGKGSFRYMFCPNCGALNRPESEDK